MKRNFWKMELWTCFHCHSKNSVDRGVCTLCKRIRGAR